MIKKKKRFISEGFCSLCLNGFICFLLLRSVQFWRRASITTEEEFITSHMNFLFLWSHFFSCNTSMVSFLGITSSDGPFSVGLSCDIAAEKSSGLWVDPKFPIYLWMGAPKVTRMFHKFCTRLINKMHPKALGERGAQLTLNSMLFIPLNHFGPSQSLYYLTTPATNHKFQEVWCHGSHHDYLKPKMSMVKVRSFSESLIYPSPEEPALFTLILNQHGLCKYRLAADRASLFGDPLLSLKSDAGALMDLGCNAYRRGKKPGSAFWVIAKCR